MSAKKSSKTVKGRATKTTTKGKAATGSATINHLTTSIPERKRERFTDESIQHLKRDAEYFARLLADEGCPTSFWSLFDSIFSDLLINDVGLSLIRRDVLPVLYPLVMIEMSTDEARLMGETLMKMVDALIPDEVSEPVRAAIYEKGDA